MLRQLDAPAAARSERVQLTCGQAGIGDELHLLLRADGVAWGAAQFCRESGSPHFDWCAPSSLVGRVRPGT